MDRRGELRMEGPNSGRIPYHSVLQTAGDGMPPIRVQNLSFEGLSVPVNGIPSGGFQLLFVSETNDLVILSPSTARSTFARRFLLDRFDLESFQHPKFAQGANPVRQTFMVQAEWVRGNSSNLEFHMGQLQDHC